MGKRVKNILCICRCKVGRNPFDDDLSEKYHYYTNYADLLMASAEIHLKGLDEIIIFSKNFDTTEEMFKEWFYFLWDLQKKEKCNILASGCDSLFIKECEIFGKYDHFSLFGINSGLIGNGTFYKTFPLSVNSIRYFPHTMEKGLWEFGDKIWKEIKPDTHNSQKKNMHGKVIKEYWGFEMYVYNRMFYYQKNGFFHDSTKNYSNLRDWLDINKPKCCLQIRGWELQPALGDWKWKPCEEEEAELLVYSATRGHYREWTKMLETFKKYNKSLEEIE